MPAIAGLRGTGDWATDERPKNFRESILWLEPNGSSPLLALTSKIASESSDDPEYSWWEEPQDAVRVKVNGALTNVATALVVDADNGDGLSGGFALRIGDLLLNTSDPAGTGDPATADNTGRGEIVYVSAVASDTAVTIVRGARGSTAAAIADNSILVKIGNVFAEGDSAPAATTRNPVKVFNYLQIFRTSYELTNTAKATRTRTGDPLKNDKKRRMFDHSVAIEEAFLWGRRHEDTGANGKPRRTTHGLNNFINTNRTVFSAAGTAFTEDNFIDAVKPIFNRKGEGSGSDRIALCGNGALTNLNKLARNSSSTRINFEKTIKVYGMELQEWVLPQGTLYVKTHPLMNLDTVFQNSMFIINPRGIKYRYLKGRDTHFKDNIQANDADAQKGEWLSEIGLEVHHEKTMAYLGGMTL